MNSRTLYGNINSYVFYFSITKSNIYMLKHCMFLINYVVNPYSVLTPPGGVLGFLKITHFTDISLFIA